MPARLTLVADQGRPVAASREAWRPAPRVRRTRLRTPGMARRLVRAVSAVLGSSVLGRRDPLDGTGDRGAVTAEYAIIIMAGVAFAGLLVAIMRSGEIRQMLVDLVQNALGSAG